MGKRSVEIMVGLFVLLGFAGFLFLALKAANLGSFKPKSSGFELFAKFDNIGGLKVRAPVRSAGVTIGRVASITLDSKTYQGVVRLDIDPKVKFPADSAAKILTSGLLGDQYVALEPGGDDRLLASGDSVVQTQSAVVLENLIGRFITGKAEGGGDAPPRPAAAAASSGALK